MVDTGCQVMILATSVFDSMCVSDPRMHSRRRSSPSGVRPGQCSLIEPCMTVTEEYGVLVGRTLVDASK